MKKLGALLFIIFFIFNVFMSKQDNFSQNNLAGEKSPYLLQHRDNPVWWQPWSNEVFNYAESEDKPIFLSVGYSTCHWCHVMERESFQDKEIAEYLNRNFVSIKVDREERPDVDAVYMNALLAMHGHGGWPMTMFLLPDKRVFYGATYLPKNQLLLLLKDIVKAWHKDREKIIKSSDQLFLYLQQKEVNMPLNDERLEDSIFKDYYQLATKYFDREYGGFGNAPKFPQPSRLELLLHIYRRSNMSDILNLVELTLTKMAKGGIYDHIGGGFSRYSTDAKWLAPHFEKMLYDNAGLAIAYLDAFLVTKKRQYNLVAEDILKFLVQEMQGKQGGFYSAIDADSEGEEGKFYIWSYQEIKELLLADEFNALNNIFNLPINGNFEGSIILSLKENASIEDKFSPDVQRILSKLYKIRKKRVHPLIDDKVITEWNGQAIEALSKGYQVTNNKKYLDSAISSAKFIRDNLYLNKQLYRRYRDGEAKFNGVLDDYAFLIGGLISLYQSTFNKEWLLWAIDLQEQQDKLFWTKKGYKLSSDSSILEHIEFSDGAIVNANAKSALNNLILFSLTLNKDYKDKAMSILTIASHLIKKYPLGYSGILLAYDYYSDYAKEIVLVKGQDESNLNKFLNVIFRDYYPNKIVALKKEDSNWLAIFEGKIAIAGKTTAYVCENNLCKLPTNDLEELKEQLNRFKQLNI